MKNRHGLRKYGKIKYLPVAPNSPVTEDVANSNPTMNTQPDTQVDVPFVRPDDLVALTGLSQATILRRLHTGEIPAARIGKSWLIPKSFVAALLNPTHQN